MAISFTLFPLTGEPEEPEPVPRKVLITGSAGRIGRSLADVAPRRYRLTLMVREASDIEGLSSPGATVVCDLVEFDKVVEAFQGIDTVVHLAADPSPRAGWDSLLNNNIIATRNVFEAAVRAGCRRVIYASSIHAVSGYPPGYQVHPDDPVNPGDLYGVSKCFGEAMGRLAAEQNDLSCIVIRIGSFQPRERARHSGNLHMLETFVSHRDLDQLICRCIDDRHVRFAVFHALSGNRFNRMDITTARELVGYRPQDDFTELNEQLSRLRLREEARPHNAQEDHGKALSADP